MEGPAAALTLQFLAWVAEAPRTYGAAMDAWRSSCPRLSIWEDALASGLVALDNRERRPMNETRVVITARGRAALAAAAHSLDSVRGKRERRRAADPPQNSARNIRSDRSFPD